MFHVAILIDGEWEYQGSVQSTDGLELVLKELALAGFDAMAWGW